MADFTEKEKTALKKIAAEKELLADIDDINATAGASISDLKDQINTIEAKRVTDVKAKRDEIAAL